MATSRRKMEVLCHGCFISFLALLFMCYGEATREELSKESFAKPKLLLLSVGGFRGDYMTKLECPNLQHFAADGTSASFVQNSINVASITNHYSIVTGLYPESHGIISKTMFDPELNLVFNGKTRAQPEWWVNVHPIWQEVKKQGQGLSALCRWPGVYGPMVSKLHCETERESLKDDINQAIQWLRNDVKLVLLYSDDIKKAALMWGPYSQQAINEVKKFDSIIKYLVDKTREINVNILLTTDSGVTDLHWDRVIDLDQCIDPQSYVLVQPQATLLMFPKRGYTSQDIYKNLTKCPHIRAYLKENLPKHFHYTHHRRIPAIIAFVPLGFVVRSSKPAHKYVSDILKGSPGLRKDMGGSGYHSGYEVMRGVFFANGPSFRPGLKYGAINNTDIYRLLCTLLGVKPRANNASFNLIKSMLKSTELKAKVDASHTNKKQPSVTMRPTKRIINYSKRHGLFGDLEMRGFLIFLACSAGILVLFCCIGCLNSMRKNMNGEFKKKTSVQVPLLSTNMSSSDEE